MAITRKIGHYAFLVGVLLAFVLALFSTKLGNETTSALLLLLIVLGVIVGFLNITAKEMTEFLIAAIALIVMGSISAAFVVVDNYIVGLGTIIDAILSYIAIFVAPAALIVSIKAIIELAEKE